MGYWWLLQVSLDVALLTFAFVVWQRFKRPPQEDPRLSRGLQLLQSKIAILEDLSDRTDKQVAQLLSLLEQKGRFVQKTLLDAESEIQKIDQATRRSKEVAEIFQDKIPHAEIIERQNTIKYVKAAQLAHSGVSPDEIVRQTELPLGEVEFIAKVNKDQMMIDTERLPEWAKGGILVEQALEVPGRDLSSLKKLGDEFRKACRDVEDKNNRELESPETAAFHKAKELSEKLFHSAKARLEELGTQMIEKTRAMTSPAEDLSKKSNEILN